jgi:hypothetical protein
VQKKRWHPRETVELAEGVSRAKEREREREISRDSRGKGTRLLPRIAAFFSIICESMARNATPSAWNYGSVGMERGRQRGTEGEGRAGEIQGGKKERKEEREGIPLRNKRREDIPQN